MPVDVLTEIEIDRPRVEVAEFAATPDNAPRWYTNIESVEWKTEPRVSVGGRVAFVARFLGRRLAYTYEVKTWLPGELLVMATTEGPFPMETTYAWTDAAEGGTRMTLRNRGEPRGFGKIGGPVMAAAMRRANRKDLAKLKLILESGSGGLTHKPPPQGHSGALAHATFTEAEFDVESFATETGAQVIVHSRIESSHLAGNLLEDPSERDLFVYLPPGYEDSDRRYPTAYLLQAR